MKYEIKGRVKSITDTRVISDKFSLREFVVETLDDKYPNVIQLQCSGRNIQELDKTKVDDVITAHFNLRGREWTSPKDGVVKVFNTLDCWKVDVDSAHTEQAPASADIPF